MADTPLLTLDADTVARAVVRAVKAKKSQTPLYRRCVWKGLRACATAPDRPDVGPGHDEGPQRLASHSPLNPLRGKRIPCNCRTPNQLGSSLGGSLVVSNQARLP